MTRSFGVDPGPDRGRTLLTFELGIVSAATFAAVILVWIAQLRFGRPGALVGAASVLAATLASWLGVTNLDVAPVRARPHQPLEVASAPYASSDTCRACHPKSYESWHASYHRSMTQAVTPDSVIPELHGTTLALNDTHYAFERVGDEFWVERTLVRGEQASDRRRIALSTGSHSMQLFWAESGRTRKLEIVPFLYLIDDARWIPRDSGPAQTRERGLSVSTR